MKLGFAVVVTAALALAGTAHAAVRVAVSPSTALIDEPVDVRVTGLAPRATVTLQATTKDYLGKLWRGRLSVRANAHGVYDSHRSMQLFWSIRPVQSWTGWYFAPPVAPTDVNLTVIGSGRASAHAVLRRRAASAGLGSTDTTLAQQGFLGRYLAPSSSAAATPAVLLIGGSGGGYASPYLASLLASHGYPSLALAYFKEPGLPQTLKDIPLEYFAKALRWLGSQPGVDSRRVVVLGASRGGEGALLIGSTYPDLVRGVVAAVPSDQVVGAYPGPGYAWTLAGEPVPYGPIAVEKIAGPVLALGGRKDEVWDSAGAVARIVDRARMYGRNDVVGVVYPRAGHGVLSVPNCPSSGTVEVAPGTYEELGGTLDGNLRAHTDSWARILLFLSRLGQ